MLDHKGNKIEVGSKVGIPAVVTAIDGEKIYADIDTGVMGGGNTQRLVLASCHVEVFPVESLFEPFSLEEPITELPLEDEKEDDKKKKKPSKGDSK